MKIAILGILLCLISADVAANRLRGAGTIPPTGATGIVSIGDSITAVPPPTGYPYLISVDKGIVLDNKAIGRYETCPMNVDMIFPLLNPQTSGNPVYTIMAGTNDEVNYGLSPGSPGPVVSGHEGLYVNCLYAAMSWLGTPNTANIIPSTCTQTGTWTITTDAFLPNQALRSDVVGDTLTCTVNVVHGVIYAWFRRGLLLCYSIDDGANVSVEFPYALTLDQSINVLRVTGLSDGPHTIKITNQWGSG